MRSWDRRWTQIALYRTHTTILTSSSSLSRAVRSFVDRRRAVGGLPAKRGLAVLGFLGAAGVLAYRSRNSSRLANAFIEVTHALDQSVGWDKLPLPLGVLVILGNRMQLRQRNLYDTSR